MFNPIRADPTILCASCACEEIVMAKIGTAHIEVKPVINEEALDALTERIEQAVALGIQRGCRAEIQTPTDAYGTPLPPEEITKAVVHQVMWGMRGPDRSAK